MVKTFISALVSVILVGLVGASIPVAIATLVSYLASRFLVDEAFEKIKDKELPDWLEWAAYGAALVGTLLLAAGLRYMSVGVLIAAAVLYVIAVVAFKVNLYLEANR